jgi:hypothetical protein
MVEKDPLNTNQFTDCKLKLLKFWESFGKTSSSWKMLGGRAFL